MKKRISALILAITLMISATMLSSCLMGDYLLSTGSLGDTPAQTNGKNDDSVTKDQLNAAIAEAIRGLSVNSGDTYEVSVNTETGVDTLAASKALLSVVSIYATFDVPYTTRVGWGSYQQGVTQSTQAGAGVIYRLEKDLGNAYIITNYHVVYNASGSPSISESLQLFLYGMEGSQYAIPATYVGGSMTYDIAVLKVENSQVLRQSAALEATTANSDDVSVLETAIAIGNPEGRGVSATLGHVNVDSEYLTMTAADGKTSINMRLMRIDTAVNGGNSGGGLFNNKGELIGIVNAKLQDSSIDNIGYAIPSNIATAVADNILFYNDGKMYRSLLNVQVKTVESSAVYDTENGKVHIRETVAVDEIATVNPVSAQLCVDDVIVSIEIAGKTYEVNRLYNVIDAMLHAKVGDTVVVHYVRAGVEGQTAVVTLDDSFKNAVQ